MILSPDNIAKIKGDGYFLPGQEIFDLPEKVLQFGTGVLLRGLPDYFIDKANRKGIFNGRIVVVKSTENGSVSAFDDQQGLYSLHVRGIENGEKVEENIVCSSISRVLSAVSDWSKVLECAHNPHLQIIISNTTEVGIQLTNDNINSQPPSSFPGKVLAFLFERFKAFNGSETSGMVIVPTELIVDNATKLKDIIFRLAEQNNMETPFINWLEKSNTFCNSLVDRIVPGKPDEKTYAKLESESDYHDDLRIVSEVYRLWAIQGDKKVAEILSFAQADESVIIKPDIEIYRELKLRMLNGTHTMSSGIAFLSGFDTVKNAMDDEEMSAYITQLMTDEIATAIPYPVEKTVALDFANKVLDRFRNPHIEHHWLSITLSYSAKIKMRILPVLKEYYNLYNSVPQHLALGFAAYIQFMKVNKQEDNKFYGELNGKAYLINDDKAAYFNSLSGLEPQELVNTILKNKELWDADLTELSGFEQAVIDNLKHIQTHGVKRILAKA